MRRRRSLLLIPTLAGGGGPLLPVQLLGVVLSAALLLSARQTACSGLAGQQGEGRGAGGLQVSLCGTISSHMTLHASSLIVLDCQTVVQPGASLTIEAGSTIRAAAVSPGQTSVPALVVSRGATIHAEGTAERPITFTSAQAPDPLSAGFNASEARGLWGGLIILGNAPIIGGEAMVEGLTDQDAAVYGGLNATDSSGVLCYVRVWYSGSILTQNDEINGITFAGVGNGTRVDHIEVAYSLDDGVEFFGGTVNVKYLSVLFCGDDAVDTDLGYQGKMQFVFILVGTGGHHAFEMDSLMDEQLRSFPQVYNLLVVGGSRKAALVSSDDQKDGLIRARRGTGGSFGNVVLTNVGQHGLRLNDCANVTITQAGPNGLSEGFPDTFWISPYTVIPTPDPFHAEPGCAPTIPLARINADPNLVMVPPEVDELVTFIDPRPRASSSVLYTNIDTVPEDDFFSWVDFKGAFDSDLWLSGWSWLDKYAKIPDNIWGKTVADDIEIDTVWTADQLYLLANQVLVRPGATLTIEKGTTVKAYRGDGGSGGIVPSLVVESGARIVARGTSAEPITFSSALSGIHLPLRGAWGGLLIRGYASAQEEGNNTSSILSHVRVWHAGLETSPSMVTSGVTLAGVNSTTTVDGLEIAYSLGGGLALLGGTVNVRHLSVLHCNTNAIAADMGYRGSMQFVFVVAGTSDRDRAVQLGGGSFLRLYNVLLLAPGPEEPIHVHANSTAYFGNLVAVHSAGPVLLMDGCPSEEEVWFSPENIASSSPVYRTTDPSCSLPWLGATVGDPQLMRIPTSESGYEGTFLDPRPRPDSIVYNNPDVPPSDAFFSAVGFRGAFSGDSWADGWCWLSSNGLSPVGQLGTLLDTDIVSDTTWTAGGAYTLVAQVVVSSGATLTVEPGVTVRAYPSVDHVDNSNSLPFLVVLPGSRLQAVGTAEEPITFTTALDPDSQPGGGLWGGLVVLGSSPVSGTASLLNGRSFGGSSPLDSSGHLEYLRIWYAGGRTPQVPRGRGLALGGVGAGTNVDHIDIALSAGDGLQLVGGSVALTHCSIVYSGGDSLDVGQGYAGSMQFLVALQAGDSPRVAVVSGSAPSLRIYNALIAGSLGTPPDGASDGQPASLELLSGAVGEFGNIIVANARAWGVLQDGCQGELTTQDPSLAGLDESPGGHLLFSANNMISGQGEAFAPPGSGCSPGALAQYDPREQGLRLLPPALGPGVMLNPQPRPDSPALGSSDSVPTGLAPASFRGAFGPAPGDLWIANWTWLGAQGWLETNVAEQATQSAKGKLAAIASGCALAVLLAIGACWLYEHRVGRRRPEHAKSRVPSLVELSSMRSSPARLGLGDASSGSQRPMKPSWSCDIAGAQQDTKRL